MRRGAQPTDRPTDDEVGRVLEAAQAAVDLAAFVDEPAIVLAETGESPVGPADEAQAEAVAGLDVAYPTEPVNHGANSMTKYFVFTLNMSYEEREALEKVEKFKEALKTLFDSKVVSFYSCGHEIAPKTGMHHIQGYIETSKRLRFTSFMKLPVFAQQKHPWVAAARGTGSDNIAYTGKAKEEGRWYDTKGEFQNFGQGKSKTLQEIKKKLDARVPLGDIYREDFETSAKHWRFFKEYLFQTRPRREEPSQVVYIWGPSGTGKSRYCAETFGTDPSKVYWLPLQKSGNNVWWDGYEGQETVIIDDWYPGYFGAGHCTFMLRLVDRYPLMVPVHGGQVNFAAKKIVFTSNTSIDEIDNAKYSGYPWNDSNPLYHRVFVREPKWEIMHVGREAPPSPPPPVVRNVTTLYQAQAARAALEVQPNARLVAWQDAKRRRLDSQPRY